MTGTPEDYRASVMRRLLEDLVEAERKGTPKPRIA